MNGERLELDNRDLSRIAEKAAEATGEDGEGSTHPGDVDDWDGLDTGYFAELVAAERYGVTLDNDDTDWYDLRDLSSGAKYEVKSAHQRIGDEYPAPGRFRLWRDQLASLQASDRKGVSWIVFVLFSEDGEPVRIRRAKPDTIAALVSELGGWNDGAEDTRDGAEQRKVPWGEVF